jgi:hypothetical protein
MKKSELRTMIKEELLIEASRSKAQQDALGILDDIEEAFGELEMVFEESGDKSTLKLFYKHVKPYDKMVSSILDLADTLK